VRAGEEREGADQRLPVRAAQAIWYNLPVLLAMDLVLLAGAVPAAALLFGGGSLLAPLVAALTLGPLWAGVVASADGMVRDEAIGVRAFANNVRRFARRGVAVSLLPAAVVTAIVGTLGLLEASPGSRWLFVPLFVDGSVATLLVVAGFSAFSLATTGGLGGWHLWRTSLAVAAAGPMATVGTLALLVLLGFLCGWAGPGLLPFLPAPFAVYLSAITWNTVSGASYPGVR
jgi:hypothetical protein